jgi:hypothetical protein
MNDRPNDALPQVVGSRAATNQVTDDVLYILVVVELHLEIEHALSETRSASERLEEAPPIGHRVGAAVERWGKRTRRLREAKVSSGFTASLHRLE